MQATPLFNSDKSLLRIASYRLQSKIIKMKATSIIDEQPTKEVPQSREVDMRGKTRVRVIRNSSEIASLLGVWELWNWHPNADIDQYKAVLKTMCECASPIIVALYRDDHPVTMLIGRIEGGALPIRVGYKNLLQMKVQKMVFMYGGLLGDGSIESTRFLVASINDCLRRGEANFAFFNSLQIGSPLHVAVTEAQNALTRDWAPAVEVHRRMNLPVDATDVYRALSTKVRKNLGWQARKLMKDFSGEVKVRCFRGCSELETALQDVEQVAKTTYQRGLGVGFTNALGLHELFVLQAQKDWLRVYVLYITNQACAFWIGRLYKNVFHSDFMGYRPEYGKYSPGMYLVMNVIEGLASGADGDLAADVDFGLGDAQYKKVLGNSEWQEASVHLFAPTVAGFGLNLLRTPAVILDRWAKRWLGKTGLLQRSKRIWRKRATRQA
jgi:hypothetical protein